MNTHGCEALVISCIDFRFQTTIREWLVRNGLSNEYDLFAKPGASKGADESLLENIGLSKKLHDIKMVIIIHHQNCGAYGPALISGSPEELETHITELNKAESLIKARFSDLQVQKYFAKLDGTMERVS